MSVFNIGEQNFEVSDYVIDNIAQIQVNLKPSYSDNAKIKFTNSGSSEKIIVDLQTEHNKRINYKNFTMECLSHCHMEIIGNNSQLYIQQLNLINISLINKPQLIVDNLDMQGFEALNTNLPIVKNRAEITIKSSEDMKEVQKLLYGVNIIPATGEFIYDPKIQYNKDQSNPVNMNNDLSVADSVHNLISLKRSMPNLRWSSPVIAWFGFNDKLSNNEPDLDIKNLEIMPGIDHKEDKTIEKWQVY